MIKIGCCGYPVSQTKYYETFNLVELNSTFYKYPSLSTAKRWRSRAPESFEFTVKAHQDITHKYKLRIEHAIEPFEKIKQVCHVLEARVILIQTPASFSPKYIDHAKEFFMKINRENFILVWETRGSLWESNDSFRRLKETLNEIGVTHVTDPLRLMPAHVSNLAYFRLHGLGERMYYYQYTNSELKRLYEVIKRFKDLEMGVYVLFNNLSMFEDARRFAFFVNNGYFPLLTGSFGIDSAKSIISQVRYPTTKNTLISRIGWRLIDLDEEKQIRLDELLTKIPMKTYNSPDEVLSELKALL